MSFSNRIKVVAVLAVLAGPFFAYLGLQDKQRLDTLEKTGITVPVTIESGEYKRTIKGAESRFFIASYKPLNGPQISKSFEVTAAFMTARTNKDAITDHQVDVLYLENDPLGSAIIVGGSDDHAALFPQGIAASVIGLIVLIFMYRKMHTSTTDVVV